MIHENPFNRGFGSRRARKFGSTLVFVVSCSKSGYWDPAGLNIELILHIVMNNLYQSLAKWKNDRVAKCRNSERGRSRFMKWNKALISTEYTSQDCTWEQCKIMQISSLLTHQCSATHIPILITVRSRGKKKMRKFSLPICLTPFINSEIFHFDFYFLLKLKRLQRETPEAFSAHRAK